MPPSNDPQSIKITLDDLAQVTTPAGDVATPAAGQLPPGTKSYGSLVEAAEKQVENPEARGNFLLQGWFYLGFAGLVGALLGWAICEPGFVDGGAEHRWGNTWIIPIIVAMLCLGFGIAESIVERSTKKALVRGALGLPLGIIFGFILEFVANIIYSIGLSICVSAGVQTTHNPATWIARGIAWMVFGIAGGLVYGIVGQSSKKIVYGILGGMIGAGIGGIIFDPIAMLTRGGALSRAVGFAIVGLATGVAVGLVESALKDRWLYVVSGPLAGKQFILYKPRTVIGSDQQCDIYLFKDSNIQTRHAVIEIDGARVQIRAQGQTYVAGQPVQLRVLQSGTAVQIGRYSFRYQERQRK
jgi:hypothetical protein